MAVNYSILVDVELDVKSIQKQLNKVKGKINLGASTNSAVKGMRELNDATARTLLTYQAAHFIFAKSAETISAMVEQVYKLDAAQIEFQKVSDLSGKALDSYVAKLTKMGGEVARTGSEMLEAATSFRKNGFNDEDAAQLGKVAAMYSNVSDEAMSAAESANFIIAQMVAFDIAPEHAEHIIDAVNEVANNFSVSSGQIANSLGVVSSSSSAMGNSLEETIGMLTAITEQTRNSSKAARGLNTIMANLAQILDDNSSNGKKITKIFDELELSMYDTNGQMLSGYDLLSGLAGKWDSLDGNTQKYIATTIAGKQNCPFKVNCWKPLELHKLQHTNEIYRGVNVLKIMKIR